MDEKSFMAIVGLCVELTETEYRLSLRAGPTQAFQS